MYKEDYACINMNWTLLSVLKGWSCDKLEYSVLCDLLCDTKYLLHSSQNPKVSPLCCFMCWNANNV